MHEIVLTDTLIEKKLNGLLRQNLILNQEWS